MTQKQTIPPPAPQQRVSLDEFFRVQAIAEQVIREKVAILMQLSARIGCADIARVDDIAASIRATTVVKQVTTGMFTIFEQKDMLPEEIYYTACDHIGRYYNAWQEPLALIDDALLFLLAHRDCLFRDSMLSEHVERQRAIRVHMLNTHRSILEALRTTPSWRDDMRQDVLDQAGYVGSDEDEAGGQQ